MRLSLGVVGARLWEEEIRSLLQLPGVIYHGSVDHQQLSEAFSGAGFLLYPTRYPETSCITVMRAMALGVLPITSRYVGSALYNLTAGFDWGPSVALEDGSEGPYRAWLELQWGPAVIAAALTDPRVLYNRRREMLLSARRKFSWHNSAQTLSDSFLGLTSY